MRTTVDLPDELLRLVKARAALNGILLKDLIALYVKQGLKEGILPSTDVTVSPRHRSPLPLIAKASRGIPIPALSHEEIARIEVEEDQARHDRSAGR